MYAHIGDRLIVEGDPARTGVIIGIPHSDGTPPYVVRWLASGYVAMVSPGHFARVLAADEPDEPGWPGEQSSAGHDGRG